jgi:hypothetical protein
MLHPGREAYAVILGKPETGSPIPAEQINAVAYLVSFPKVQLVKIHVP